MDSATESMLRNPNAESENLQAKQISKFRRYLPQVMWFLSNRELLIPDRVNFRF